MSHSGVSQIRAGMMIGGEYRIEPASEESLEVGVGGMGAVYLAHDVNLDRKVAIKTIQLRVLGKGAERESFLKRFQREAQLAAACRHPALITIYRASRPEETEQGFAWYAMEYIEGGADLGARLDEMTGPGGISVMPLPEVVGYLTDLAGALREIHAHDIIHRDIKLENLMVYPTPERRRLKLVDFGVARPPESSLTATKHLLGTPSYLSPQRAKAKLDGVRYEPTAQDDLFSLGCVAYRLLTGYRPYGRRGDPTGEILEALCTDVPEPPRASRPDLTEGLEHVTLKLLERETADRYASAQEVLDDLDRLDALPAYTMKMAPMTLRAALLEETTNPGRPSANRKEATASVDPGSFLDFPAVASPAPEAQVPGVERHSRGGFSQLPKTTRAAVVGAGVLVMAFALGIGLSGGESGSTKSAAPAIEPSSLVETPKPYTADDVLRAEADARRERVLAEERERRAAEARAEAPEAPQAASAVKGGGGSGRRKNTGSVGGNGAQPASTSVASVTEEPRRKKLDGMLGATAPGGVPGPANQPGPAKPLGIELAMKLEVRLTAALSSDAPDSLVTSVLERPFKTPAMPEALPAGTRLFGRAEFRTGTGRIDVLFNRLQLPNGTTYPIVARGIEANGQAGLVATVSQRDERAKSNAGEAVLDAVDSAAERLPGTRATGRFTGDKRDDARALRDSREVLTLPLHKKIWVQFQQAV